jgi:predicted dehydrogenase
MKVAIAGLGNIGKRWAEVLTQAPDIEVAVFVDPLIGSPQVFPWLAEYPHIPQVQTLDVLLHTDVDALVVTASSPAHAEIVRRGLEFGVHVLVEKPFATQLADAEALVALAREKGRILMVSQNYRFFPGPQTLRSMGRNGELGAVRAVIGQFWYDWPGRPYQHQMMHPMGLEMAIHHFDLVRAIFDANAVSGQVQEWNPARSPYRMGGALEALFTMATRNSSFPFLYTGSLVTQRTRTPWGGLWRFEFDRGTVIADNIDGQYGLFLAGDGRYRFLSAFADESMAFDKSFNHFHECIKNGEEAWCSGADNLNTLRMVLSFIVGETEHDYAKDRP